LEQVGEVGVELQLHEAERGLLREVRDLEIFTHAATDVAVTRHQEMGVGASGRGLPATDEHPNERIRCRRDEWFWFVPVQTQPDIGKKTGVTEDESLRTRRINVSRRCGQAERRALDEGDDAIDAAEARARARGPRLGHPRQGTADSTGPVTRMRVALVAPGWFPLPPAGYGGGAPLLAPLAYPPVRRGPPCPPCPPPACPAQRPPS